MGIQGVMIVVVQGQVVLTHCRPLSRQGGVVRVGQGWPKSCNHSVLCVVPWSRSNPCARILLWGTLLFGKGWRALAAAAAADPNRTTIQDIG